MESQEQPSPGGIPRASSWPDGVPEGDLIEEGQGFASPVPPFAGEVRRFPDEPGARPLTCQLSVQVGGSEGLVQDRQPSGYWGTNAGKTGGGGLPAPSTNFRHVTEMVTPG